MGKESKYMDINFIQKRFFMKFEHFLLALILILAFTLRLYKVDNPVADWHSWRQADTASVSRIFFEEGINLLYPRYYDISSLQTGYENPNGYRFVEFPIFNAINVIFYRIFDKFTLEEWGRFISIISALFSTFLIYLIGKKFFGVATGLLSAAFYAILPYNIYFTRVILPEPLATVLALGALWFFIEWIEYLRPWQIWLSTFFFALAILVKPFTVFYGIPMLYLAIDKFGILGMLDEIWFWIFGAFSVIPFFLWRIWIQQEGLLIGIPFWQWAFNGDAIRFKPAFWWWIFEERIGRLILGGWGLVAFVAGLMKKGAKSPWFLHSFLFGQFIYVSVVATANVRHDYYQTFLIPVISLVLGYGTVIFWNLKLGDKYIRRLILILSLVFAVFFSFYQTREFYKINHPEIIAAGNAVERLTPPDAKVIAPYFGDTAFLYQTHRFGWPQATLPIDQMIERLGASYYVSVNFDQQTQQIMDRYQIVEKTKDYVVVRLK